MTYRIPESSELCKGSSVQWLYSPRGGYGYIHTVPGTVETVGKSRVRIAALKKDGSTVSRWVKRESLRIGKAEA